MHYFGLPKLWNISIGPKMMFGSVSEYFTNLRQVKRCRTCLSGLNALFRGTEVVKHPFYSIGPQMMFGSVSENFTNLRHVKDAKLASEPEWTISGQQSCETCIGPKMISRIVSEYFTNLRRELNVVFQGTEVVKRPFYSIGHNWFSWVFRIISQNLQQVKDALLASQPECTISSYQTCETSPLNFTNLRHVKDAELASGPEWTISG
jgi:hypothetical protein